MKRVLAVLGIIALTALITYLAVTQHLARERAAKLDRALMDAERRVLELEAEIENAKSRLAEFTATQPRVSVQAPSASGGGLTAGLVARVTNEPPAISLPANSVGSAAPAAGLARYAAAIGAGITNLVRIEGTSTVHSWQVEGHLVGGTAEFQAGFPAPAGETGTVISTNAKVSVFIPVRSLRSVEKSGAPYSDAMDEIMYGKLRAEDFRRITYTLKSLALKEPAREPAATFVYEATGNLCVAGETNTITMPVTILSLPEGRIQFAGSVQVKMTDFKITPPSPSVGGLRINTGDDVTLRFVWTVKPVGGLEARK